jgi:hypothetical protein
MLLLIIFGLIGFALYSIHKTRLEVEKTKRRSRKTVFISSGKEQVVEEVVEHDPKESTVLSKEPIQKSKQVLLKFWDKIK